MTHHTDAERAKFEAMRAEFEAIFGPMPWGCTWTGRGYCATEYNAWNANSYSDKFDGWVAAWQAARRAPAAPVPQGWKLVPEWPTVEMSVAGDDVYREDGPEVFSSNTIYTRMLAAAPQPPEAEENPLQEPLDEALQSLEFYKRRCDLLQSIQPRMRDPERTMVCDVLANGHLLQGGDGQPDKARYAPPEAAPVPQFSRIAQKKLDYLLEAGEAITGYAIENKDGRRGAIDCHGFVYWWQDAAAPQQLANHGIQERST
ncbi:hypothetical protein N5D67_00895 [Comamonas aquatica]|uniref:hypothetical protein n=1 Tax=Comamonas aquatica TaxID=225991 RepID=UPI002449DAD8|nr:hypothetical protein [Comamonas aquatica]MDH1900867.1 hypothetical protein [Comamonas aquatica]